MAVCACCSVSAQQTEEMQLFDPKLVEQSLRAQGLSDDSVTDFSALDSGVVDSGNTASGATNSGDTASGNTASSATSSGDTASSATSSGMIGSSVIGSGVADGNLLSDSLLEPNAIIQHDTVELPLPESIELADGGRGEPLYVPSADQTYRWQVLPDGLMWRSYLAGPHEPRISTVLFHTEDGENYWDATLGGRVGLLRYGTFGAVHPHGWQWDLEGAVMTRLDLDHREDVVSMDYRFGTQITRAEGPWSMKFGYFHISSHVGDEFLERNPTFTRINYVTESLVLGLSRSLGQSFRLYGETAYAYHIAGGADRYQFQFGGEYSPQATYRKQGAPFAALNMDIRQAVRFDPAFNFQTGWQWKGPYSGRSLRIGMELYDGHSTQFEFFDRPQRHIGIGAWFDY